MPSSLPYTLCLTTGAQNVFENLQKKIGLATIKSVLDALAASGSIKFKEFGKSKVRQHSRRGRFPCSLSPRSLIDPTI